MTTPSTPSTPKQVAKDVAKELDKRRRRRRLALFALWAAAIIAAALYLRCGRGWGLGGGGEGSGSGSGTSAGTGSATATPESGSGKAAPCAVRIASDGITLAGKPATEAQIVESCAGGAEIVVTGDAREGVWTQLRDALDKARIPFSVRTRH
jgi:hypothetical protein